jgi:hypothetical protein
MKENKHKNNIIIIIVVVVNVIVIFIIIIITASRTSEKYPLPLLMRVLYFFSSWVIS